MGQGCPSPGKDGGKFNYREILSLGLFDHDLEGEIIVLLLSEAGKL